MKSRPDQQVRLVQPRRHRAGCRRQTSSAAKDYLQAIKIDPTFESALYNLGVLRFQSNEIPDAITYLARATVANPKDANAHWNLGLALIRHATPADNKRADQGAQRGAEAQPDAHQDA